MNTEINENANNKLGETNHQVIHIFVDGEECEATQKMMTPNEIIRECGQKDPSIHYLVQIHGHERTSYEGKGDTPIELHNGMKFQIISTGPCTVSDVLRTGIETFIHSMSDLGYIPRAIPGKPDHVVIDYEVQCGKFSGTKVLLGFVVPADFPVTTPSGPHVSPHIHSINAEGQHPAGRVFQTQAMPFQEAIGGQWQYWSRPHPNWLTSRKTVTAYMSHIWRLWETQ